MVANYATSQYVGQTAAGAPVLFMAGATRDTVTDATAIATWAANWTANAPVAGNTITGVMAGYLTAYPRGPQVT